MKNYLMALFVLLTFILPVYGQEASEKPVLYVDNFANQGKSQQTVGENLKRSLKTIVEITHKYDVIYSDNFPAYLVKKGLTNIPSTPDLNTILSNYKDLGIDYVLTGTFKADGSGNNVDIQVRVVQLINVTEKFNKKYKSPTDAEIFDRIDQIGLDLANVLTGQKLGFGSLEVYSSVPDSDIFLNGLKAGKGRVTQNTAIAGLKHLIEIKNREGKTLFEKEILIRDKFTYDLTYDYKEFVEIINLTNTNRVAKSQYKPASDGLYIKTGPVLTLGRGNFAWAGWYLDIANATLELDATYIPKLSAYTYDSYISWHLSGCFHLFNSETSLWNFMTRLGVVSYYGITYGFPSYSPAFYIGFGFELKPDWNFMPGFMRKWVFSVEIGTEQDIGLLWKNYSVNEQGVTSGDFYRNMGLPMLSIGLKF